jgi:hypothetical protein
MGTMGSFPGGKEARGVKLTAHLHLVPRSRVRGAIHALPQYAFLAWWSVIKHRDNFTFTLLFYIYVVTEQRPIKIYLLFDSEFIVL